MKAWSKHPDTDLLRAIAIILIFNSHLELYYPISYMGTGGAIGNSLFVFLSAYGLSISAEKGRKSFSEWFAGRIRRIYPAVWVTVILLMLPSMIYSGKIWEQSFLGFMGNFFYPPFWFLKALLIFYILGFMCLQDYDEKRFYLFVVIFGSLYVVCYITCIDLSKWSVERLPFKLIFYFLVFLFGIKIAKQRGTLRFAGTKDLVKLVACVFVVYLHKFAMVKGVLSEVQVIQQAALFPCLFYLVKVSRSSYAMEIVKQNSIISALVSFLSKHTLEIYIVHITISQHILALKFMFPWNLVTLLLSTVLLSAVVSQLSGMMDRWTSPRIGRPVVSEA